MVAGARGAAKIVAVLRELAECHALLAGCDYTLQPGGSCNWSFMWRPDWRLVGHLKLASMASEQLVVACDCLPVHCGSHRPCHFAYSRLRYRR